MGHDISHMGHKVGHLFHHKEHAEIVEPERDPRIDIAFNTATKGADKLTFNHIQELFPEHLARSIWPFLSGDKPTDATLTVDEFADNVLPLLEFPLGVYIGIFRPAETFIAVCAQAAGVELGPEDLAFLEKLRENMTEKGDTPEDLVRWKTGMCSHVGRALNELICHKFLGEQMPTYHLISRILSQSQMWFLQSCLPYTYFPKELGEEKQWTLLHASAIHGMSVQRFILNVFGYRGHTVMIVKLNDGRSVALATEAEWRDDTIPRGGRETAYFELDPEIKRMEMADSIHCNFKSYSKGRGLMVKDVLHIDGDLSQVYEMEVWGCSGHAQQQAKEDQKKWLDRQAERRRKVPMPGTWDDNPDKELLEMGGVHFSNERKNMEMEARRREELEKD